MCNYVVIIIVILFYFFFYIVIIFSFTLLIIFSPLKGELTKKYFFSKFQDFQLFERRFT